MIRVTMQFSGKPVKKFTFDKEAVTIGRDPGCDIVIENIGASRRHASIQRTEAGYVLADLKSHNGTFVGGEKVFHHRLTDSDEFFIGKYAFVFEQLDPVVECDDGVVEPSPAAGVVPDMTFRMERKEIEKVMHASDRGASTQLVQIAPERDKKSLVLEEPYYLLGKDAACAVRVHGFLQPKVAAILVHTDHGWRLVGLSKKAHVNGKFHAEAHLNDGDLVQVGSARFRFCQA